MDLIAIKGKVEAFADRYKLPAVAVYGGGAMVVMLAFCVLIGIFASKPAQRPNLIGSSPNGLPSHLAAEQNLGKPTNLHVNGGGGVPAAQSEAAEDPLASALVPAQPKPNSLAERTAAYTLQSRSQLNGPWADVGQEVVPATIADFSSRPLDKWNDMAPSDGAVRNTWTFWIQIPEDGQQTFIVHLDGRAEADGNLFIDDQVEPSVKVHLAGTYWGNAEAVTSEAAVGLAKGWHKLAFQLGRYVQRNDHRTAQAKLYLKASNQSAPEQITPWGTPGNDSAKLATK
jgi:hypothetical protein